MCCVGGRVLGKLLDVLHGECCAVGGRGRVWGRGCRREEGRRSMAVVCRSKGQRVASSEVQGGLVARRPGGVLRSGEPAPEARADRRARTAVPLLPEKGKPRLDPSIPSPGGKCKLQCSRLLLHLLPTYAPTPTASVNRSPTADTTQTPRYSY